MAAISAKQIDFHLMGYYPITPSTEIAELLDEMKAAGEHDIVMVPADGEHGAAGICYGAATGGGRVFNATSSQGLLYSLEELPVQSGTRYPMLLDLATRAVSGPLDIRGDHSDVYFALNTGWLIFMARGPQAVYDLNLIALRVAERADVRLPAIVAFDGFFTSHQKRRVSSFEDDATVHDWLGPVPEAVTALDPRHPVTIGPYMNDPDLINNKYQLERAMDAALAALPEVVAEYEALSGRRYDPVDLYRMDDAEVAVFLLNSAAETAKDVADRLRDEGVRAGVVSPNVIRPFPADTIREALRGVRAVVLGERSGSYGGARRQPLARGEVRAEGRPGEPHALPEPRLRPRRARLLRRGRRGVLPARAGGRRARRGGGAVRLLRRGAGRSREAARRAAARRRSPARRRRAGCSR